jgi:hypothetical protein
MRMLVTQVLSSIPLCYLLTRKLVGDIAIPPHKHSEEALNSLHEPDFPLRVGLFQRPIGQILNTSVCTNFSYSDSVLTNR